MPTAIQKWLSRAVHLEENRIGLHTRRHSKSFAANHFRRPSAVWNRLPLPPFFRNRYHFTCPLGHSNRHVAGAQEFSRQNSSQDVLQFFNRYTNGHLRLTSLLGFFKRRTITISRLAL